MWHIGYAYPLSPVFSTRRSAGTLLCLVGVSTHQPFLRNGFHPKSPRAEMRHICNAYLLSPLFSTRRSAGTLLCLVVVSTHQPFLRNDSIRKARGQRCGISVMHTCFCRYSAPGGPLERS